MLLVKLCKESGWNDVHSDDVSTVRRKPTVELTDKSRYELKPKRWWLWFQFDHLCDQVRNRQTTKINKHSDLEIQVGFSIPPAQKGPICLHTTLFCLSFFFLNVNIHSICITSIKILCKVRLILQCIFGNVHKWITKLTCYQLVHIVLVKKISGTVHKPVR